MVRGITQLIENTFNEFGVNKFLSHTQDMWTDRNANTLIGSSLKILTKDMECVSIATCLFLNNESHGAPWVAAELDRMYSERYGFRLSDRVLFTGSDTTMSAQNVHTHLEALQENCKMHSSSLAYGYGVGFKENTKTTSVKNPVTGKIKKVIEVMTPGGPFLEGLQMINSFVAIVNYFVRSGQKKKDLATICEQHGLPIIALKNPCKTRVASHMFVIQSVLQIYKALKLYAESLPVKHPYQKHWNTITPGIWEVSTYVHFLSCFTFSLPFF